MSKLTQAGNLYLQDYYILDQARADLDAFLDEILEDVYNSLSDLLNEISSPPFQWSITRNKSNKGRMDISLSCNIETEFFRKDKVNICIIYKDIRNATDLSNPASIRISVWSPLAAMKLKNYLQEYAEAKLSSSLYGISYKDLSLGDSTVDADTLAECIIDLTNKINNAVNYVYHSNGNSL